jgi:hypothetical protein
MRRRSPSRKKSPSDRTVALPKSWQPRSDVCAICGRAGRGFGWFDPNGGKVTYRACSMQCVDIIIRRFPVIDPTEHEISALLEASQPAGEYIEALGRTDMATWSNDEWMTFLEITVTAYTDALRKLADNAVPF